jgi:hypothetical protein
VIRRTRSFQLSELTPALQQELAPYIKPDENILYCSGTTQYPGLLAIFNWTEILDTGRIHIQIVTNQQVICLDSHLNKISYFNHLKLRDINQVLYTNAFGEHHVTIKGAGNSALNGTFESTRLAQEFQQALNSAREALEQKPANPSEGHSPIERLRTLDGLLIAGLITEEEYQNKRKEILSGI